MVFLNGKWVHEKKACISISDHGFLYGDGVYETIRVYNGKPFLLSDHLRRLNNSMQGIRLPIPLSLMQLGLAIQKTIALNRHKEAVVRLTITRGPGEAGFDPNLCERPTVLITSRPVKAYPLDCYKRGMTVAVVSVRRNITTALPPFIKSTSCLNGILAKMESQDLGAHEGLMISSDKSLTEGTVSNVFLVSKGTLKTPSLSEGLLPGVTRDWVGRLARSAGIKFREEKLGLADLTAADEVFLTSTIMEVMPVSRIILNHDQQRRPFRLGPYSKTSGYVGPVTLQTMRLFRESIKRFASI